MIPFHQTSYLTQVRRLKNLARAALKSYPILVQSLEFIHHGENTTFKVTARNGRRYLLRVARHDYHTLPAMKEEMKWLARIATRGIVPVPNPVRSKNGQLVESVEMPGVGLRRCCIFEWIDGHFIEKSLTPQIMFDLGRILGLLQKTAPKSRHRRYWTADGLVGPTPKFGPVHTLIGVPKTKSAAIERARKLVYRKLRAFERRYPERQGLIHADAHFGNILKFHSGLGIIDFDDCGVGFFAHDLAIPLISAEYMLGKKRRRELPQYRQALIDGYSSVASWSKADERILEQLIPARKIMMLGWLNSRADNPRLKKHLKGSANRTLRYLRSIGLAD